MAAFDGSAERAIDALLQDNLPPILAARFASEADRGREQASASLSTYVADQADVMGGRGVRTTATSTSSASAGGGGGVGGGGGTAKMWQGKGGPTQAKVVGKLGT